MNAKISSVLARATRTPPLVGSPVSNAFTRSSTILSDALIAREPPVHKRRPAPEIYPVLAAQLPVEPVAQGCEHASLADGLELVFTPSQQDVRCHTVFKLDDALPHGVLDHPVAINHQVAVGQVSLDPGYGSIAIESQD